MAEIGQSEKKTGEPEEQAGKKVEVEVDQVEVDQVEAD